MIDWNECFYFWNTTVALYTIKSVAQNCNNKEYMCFFLMTRDEHRYQCIHKKIYTVPSDDLISLLHYLYCVP